MFGRSIVKNRRAKIKLALKKYTGCWMLAKSWMIWSRLVFWKKTTLSGILDARCSILDAELHFVYYKLLVFLTQRLQE
jgi:hypothetical protein